MNIALINYYLGKINRGGETFTHELANGLTDLGHNVTVGQGGEQIENAKYKSIKISSPNDLPKLSDIDCVIPINGRVQAIKACIWAKMNHRCCIISGQSGLGIDDKINAWCFPDCFVALTNYQKEWIKKINPFIHVEVIPNGVNTNIFNPKVTPKKIHLSQPIVLVVAALTKEKRIDLVVEAVEKMPKVSLLIVGDGPEKSYIEKIIKSKIPNRGEIQTVTYQKMPSIYTACNSFVFPTSSQESFGIAIIEAMASGLSVVASDDPIRKELVGDAGYLVDPTNTVELINKISSSLSKKWGEAPVKQAKKFTWGKIATQYSDVINKICQKYQ